jgi:hypothetical protein
MKLPNAEKAMVDIRKIREYCLNQSHPIGKHKARLFNSVLGLNQENSDRLREILLNAVKDHEAELGINDIFGQRYVVDFIVVRENDQATIRSCWIIETASEIPKLTTCFIL